MPSKQIYFDYNATAPVLPELITRYKNYLSIYGNPSSFHALGRQARTAIDEARETIASHIGAHRSQVLFCASGSEANTQVIHTVVMKQILEHKPQHIIYSAIEHPCILNAVKWAEKMGVPVTEIGTNTLGQINLRDIEAAIRPDTTLITIMWANNEIGTIQPVQEVAEIAKNHGIHFHCDGVQALGKLAIDLNRIRIDSLTLSGHKIGAPKGISALFIRDETWLRPMIWGGSQERQLRAGTESTPAILAFADAVALAESERETMIKRLTDYKHRLIDWLPSVNGRLNGDPNGLATTVNIRFPEISGESIVRNLDLMGIAASTGSACATGSIEPSHVINALNLPESDRRTPFRISMGRGTQADDILTLQTALETILTRLRNRR